MSSGIASAPIGEWTAPALRPPEEDNAERPSCSRVTALLCAGLATKLAAMGDLPHLTLAARRWLRLPSGQSLALWLRHPAIAGLLYVAAAAGGVMLLRHFFPLHHGMLTQVHFYGSQLSPQPKLQLQGLLTALLQALFLGTVLCAIAREMLELAGRHGGTPAWYATPVASWRAVLGITLAALLAAVMPGVALAVLVSFSPPALTYMNWEQPVALRAADLLTLFTRLPLFALACGSLALAAGHPRVSSAMAYALAAGATVLSLYPDMDLLLNRAQPTPGSSGYWLVAAGPLLASAVLAGLVQSGLVERMRRRRVRILLVLVLLLAMMCAGASGVGWYASRLTAQRIALNDISPGTAQWQQAILSYTAAGIKQQELQLMSDALSSTGIYALSMVVPGIEPRMRVDPAALGLTAEARFSRHQRLLLCLRALASGFTLACTMGWLWCCCASLQARRRA